MRIVYFTHALTSCWNHGNAHFQRGLLGELAARGHEVVSWEPEDGWSRQNLVSGHGEAALAPAHRLGGVLVRTYGAAPDAAAMIEGAQLVIVHEWTDPRLVADLGAAAKRRPGLVLLFHDTHHRAISDPAWLSSIDLDGYDGVLAFGRSLAEHYARRGWGDRVYVFHEAADTRRFRPGDAPLDQREGVVWVGNWGDGERSAEITQFLLEPARDAHLPLDVYGVRYPEHALAALARHGAAYKGWLANLDVPAVLAAKRMTVHIPRQFYRRVLPGIPTIRVFEALACGIPLICAPWDDCEGLFRPGEDYLVARDGDEMRRAMLALAGSHDLAATLIRNGLARIRARHTCGHRADELLAIAAALTPSLAGAQP
jgi:spore maturation protein CgeB